MLSQKLHKDSESDGEAESSNNSTLNDTSSSNSTDGTSVAVIYPYWRATREKKESKSDKEEKKPYEPRPAKYRENYEDKGLKVFKPDYEVIGTVTTDNHEKLGGPKDKSKKEKTSDEKEDDSEPTAEGSDSKKGTAPA